MRAHAAIRAISLIVLSLAMAGAVACDKGTPTAPANATLVVTANPLTITPNGASTITITALRSSGQPVNPGTEIRLDTTLGSIDPVVTTDERGQAQATLRGDGTGGEATITARSGTATAQMVKVQIGAKAASVVVITTPASIPDDEPAQVDIVAIVLDAGGQPIQGASVILTTTAGRLASQGAILTTNARGEVRDRLNASVEAVEGAGASITIRAQAGSGGASVNGTATITVRPST